MVGDPIRNFSSFPNVRAPFKIQESVILLLCLTVMTIFAVYFPNAISVFADSLSNDPPPQVQVTEHPSPRIVSRSIGDNVLVGSTFDNIGARIPRVFNVGITDGLNVA